MTPTKIRIRSRQEGGHIRLTFWTGVEGYTFANVGDLVMSTEDENLFRQIFTGKSVDFYKGAMNEHD